ncbi:MAG TPA: class I SAM-dependent methyltransferase [Kofleriaceae bacterium]|nr:class I SAM-dependent methyltransferase [Kofleriaceae bacterium]
MSQSDRDRWNARWREREPAGEPRGPSVWIASLDPVLPRRGRALDIAGGTGRHAMWLAGRGLHVTIADVSEVGLAIAGRAAAAAGVSVDTIEIDLEREPLPPGPWDVVIVFHYLQRSLFSDIAAVLAPGGLLAFCHPTLANLERNARPGPAFLLDPGEAPALVVRSGLEIVSSIETWSETGRHEARVVARRPSAAAHL